MCIDHDYKQICFTPLSLFYLNTQSFIEDFSSKKLFLSQERACEHVKDPRQTSLFASTQCIREGSKKLTYEMCFPPKKEILKRVKKVVKKIKAKRVFVATDHDPMLKDLSQALKSLKVGYCFKKLSHC